ncbi:MAG: hypothetical protein P4K98_10900 [Bryobacteraceae bacterium]|nr:hypothetical protein [Bryobacteraceae bacterium]
MRIPLQTRTLLLITVSATALLGQTDAREIIRRAVAADERNWQLARNYIFSERTDLRYLDAQGQVKLREVSLHDVMLLEGSPYERLVARNDRPLPPAEEKKEQEKLAQNTAERRAESAAKRARRLAEYFARPEWQREAWRELPEAFDFRLDAEEAWDGHDLYVIEATPRLGYQPKSRTARILARVRARLWVDKQDYHLVKGEVEVIDTISVGLFLVLVSKGSRGSFEETRVNDEVWLPSKVRASASARLGLVKVVRIEQELSYTNCRESQSSAPILSRIKTRQAKNE